MPDTQDLAKDEISKWLKGLGQDRTWLAQQLNVSKSTIDGWFSNRRIPKSMLQSVRLLMAKEDTTHLIGDPEGNLVSFTLAEFERIEATRQRLHYDSRPPMYRDAIMAFIEADEARQAKIHPLQAPAQTPLARVAESPILAPVEPQNVISPTKMTENAILSNENALTPSSPPQTRTPVVYTPPKRSKP